MVKTLLITNLYNCHYEIIESILLKSYEILKINKRTPMYIYLYIYNNKSFKKYINFKYPFVRFQNLPFYDYNINCTIYDRDFDNLNKDPESKTKYIAHELTDRLKTNPNVYFLTPLSKKNFIYCDILPFKEYKKLSNTPIYLIQGNLNQGRRNLSLLIKILEGTYNYNFMIKLVGGGYLPRELEKYKDKIVLKNNLNFIDFHKEFLDAYCILPLISKETHSEYYTDKLTSSINYCKGYKIKCLIDKDLQEIYDLNNVEIYNDIDDIVQGFKKTLEQFYDR